MGIHCAANGACLVDVVTWYERRRLALQLFFRSTVADLILGISAFYHDSAACIVRDGEVIAAAQEERFTRRKHDHQFPSNAISFCLEAADASPADLDAVAFYDKPWLKFERLLETYLAFAPRGIKSFMMAMPLWLKEKLWMDDTLRRSMDFDGTLYYPEHHQSHAASAFFPSPFQSAAILTIDGVGEWSTATWGTGSDNKIELTHELRFPHSLGLLYSAFTYHTGFRVNSGEYKLMGLAPYGTPRYVNVILDRLLDLKDDGSFRMNMRYFNYCTGLTMTNSRFDDLFGGPPRQPEAPITTREMDMAASVQVVTEEIVLRMARHVRRATGERNLCLAGGVALNCVANGKLLRERIFDKLWIQPAAGDAGGALGAALFAHYHVAGNKRKADGRHDTQKGSYLGPAFSSREIRQWLTDEGHPFAHFDGAGELAQEVAKLLDDGQVVGLFSGRMEFGPRALGGRSILGDPRRIDMQSAMNLKIKFRESFRPFAPACLSEHVSEFFDLNGESPYMLLVAPLAEEHRVEGGVDELVGFNKREETLSDIPAVTHVDYSARIQTVDGQHNPRFRSILEAFHDRTGCPVLINTSFNVRGEPIVCTPEEAYTCFMQTEMDALVLEDVLLLKRDQPDRLQRPAVPDALALD